MPPSERSLTTSAIRRGTLPTLHSGFTLLDLMIAVAIILILFSVAIPSVSNAVSRVQASAARSAITTTLFDGLRNATVLGQEVVVCPAPGGQCAGARDWSRGWIAFVDLDHNRLRTPNEPLLRRDGPLDEGVRLYGSPGRPRIVYQPNGSNAGSNLSFTLCDRRGAAYAVSLILSNGGRLRTDKPTASAAVDCASGL